MDLKKQSEIISCERISFLTKKYNIHNSHLFEKQLIPNSCGNLNTNNNFLKSSYISKKNCIFESTEPNQGLWETQFESPEICNNKKTPMFNMNTKVKFNYDDSCP